MGAILRRPTLTGLGTFSHGSISLQYFFGVTRDKIKHIGEGIIWLSFISQVDSLGV